MIREERELERSKKRKRKRTLIGIAVALLLALALVLVVWKVFRVRDVVVEGNELYGDEVITAEILNDEYSWNSLYVYFKYRFMKTNTIPFIDTMKISLDNPHTLHIIVYEKGVLGYFYDAELGQNVYFDKDGFVVETSERIIEDVPEIKGISYEEIVLYEQLAVNPDLLNDILTLTQALKRNELVPDAILYGETNSPILIYSDVWVRLGSNENLTQKLAHLREILPYLADESGVLHLEDWTEDSSNIVFERDE